MDVLHNFPMLPSHKNSRITTPFLQVLSPNASDPPPATTMMDPSSDPHPFSPSPDLHPLLLSSHPLSSPHSSPSPSPPPSPHSPSAVRSPSPSPLYSSITVGSPLAEPPPSSFVSYLVSTHLPDGTTNSVRRRFRDLLALSDRLAESHRGLFLPPRPDKAVLEAHLMHRTEFVEQRRLAVERYLCRLAAHPVLGRCDELQAFLCSPGAHPLPETEDATSRVIDGATRLPGQLFGGAAPQPPPPQEVVQPARGGRDLLRIFREMKQSVVNDWGGGRAPPVEEDREFLERKEKVRELEQQLSTASRQAEALVKSQQDMGETMGLLGLSLIKLTKFETEEAVYSTQKIRAGDIRLVGTAAVKASRLYRESNAHTVKHLDTLHEYLGLMLAVHSAFQERASALLTVQTLLTDLSSLNAKAEKLEAASSRMFGADKSRIQKLEELKETIRATEDSKCVALREYERIKENNMNELERFNTERRRDFFNMMKGFVNSQVAHAEKIADVWEKVVEDTSKYARQPAV